ncbi:MAG: Holliday junction branch migration protein RuvA [Acidobacteria bacterium]|nr:Holliday junction branch migration protein RuvA [Acidobacteriota bacterium]
MIAHLSGKLLEKNATHIIVDVAGVGYEVNIPLSTFYELGEEGDEIALRIYTHVREDAIQLFGFSSPRERDLYLKVISVQGIGPKLGITVLSGIGVDELVRAVKANDLARLTSIPGIGRKTAERLVIDLRDKVGELALAKGGSEAGSPNIAIGDGHFDDALSALINLGYQRAVAEKALSAARSDVAEPTVQKLLRRALQLLAK